MKTDQELAEPAAEPVLAEHQNTSRRPEYED